MLVLTASESQTRIRSTRHLHRLSINNQRLRTPQTQRPTHPHPAIRRRNRSVPPHRKTNRIRVRRTTPNRHTRHRETLLLRQPRNRRLPPRRSPRSSQNPSTPHADHHAPSHETPIPQPEQQNSPSSVPTLHSTRPGTYPRSGSHPGWPTARPHPRSRGERRGCPRMVRRGPPRPRLRYLQHAR